MANSKLDDLATELLAEVLADFRSQGLESDHLSEEYEGPTISSLEMHFCRDGGHSKVDFDLALKDLEKGKLIDTGPHVPYKNDPHSSVAIIAIFSKREFVYLTEKGYKTAQQSAKKPKTRERPVYVSGNFHNSPVAIGDTVNQATTINIENDSEVIEYLAKLHSEHDPASGEKERSEIVDLVDSAKAGDTPKARFIFQRLFGAAKEATKGLGWAVIAEILKAQIGL
jgi:hypothetical protein